MTCTSIVLKVKNEENNIADALDSLIVQEEPIEIIVVDGCSTDRTPEIVQGYASRDDRIRFFQHGGTRGESLNYGLGMAQGDIIALTDGDVIANPNWVKEMRRSLEEGADIVAGKTVNIGLRAWEDLHRVELFNQGYDCTWPGCNLAFRRSVYEEVGGVDPWFITAEDIDFNLRATVYGFFNQAFWNGAGRKQLTMKHGALWDSYNPVNMFRQKMSFWAFVRLFFAWMGYTGFKFFGEPGLYGKR
jgi:glycosyltransferase involved in cell wall biosynthesis